MGVELRSQGADLFGGVCVNVLRHPAWGRAQETYGEDPYHLGVMGAALVRGVQRHAMACVKHFACNSIENSRMKVDVQIDERTLREVFLPAFRACVDAGAAVVMTAYNRVNGEWCSHHSHLLRDVLRHDWGFTGFTISDWVFAVRDGAAALRGGLDVEMPYRWRYRSLPKALDRGDLDERLVDEAARRVIATKRRFADVGEPDRYRPDVVAGPEHRALAREVATKAMVLLRNDPVATRGDVAPPVLPIDLDDVATLAVVGRLAGFENTGDKGSSRVRAPSVVTPLAGLEEVAAGRARVVASASDDVSAAIDAARDADVAVVVVGYTWRDEGENLFLWGGDRAHLTLSRDHERLVEAVVAVQPRTVVVVVTGSAVVMDWRDHVPALVVAWYAGMEGGRALAGLLTGRDAFSGRLPCVFPRAAGDLPPFDPSAKRVTYGPLHGYRWLAATGRAAAYPFGFGLAYTTFAYRDVAVEADELTADDTARLTVELANTGARAGEETVQVYASAEDPTVARAPLDLVAFTRERLDPGETRPVILEVPICRLAHYDEVVGWQVTPGTYRLGIGPSADPATHETVRIRVV
jgi:beta-glucosidase